MVSNIDVKPYTLMIQLQTTRGVILFLVQINPDVSRTVYLRWVIYKELTNNRILK